VVAVASPKRLILVTGCSRSGTTAVGSNLVLGSGARYIYEPFNSITGMTEIDDRFPVPGAGLLPLDRFDACVARLRALDLRLKPGVGVRDTGWRRLVKQTIGSRSRLSYWLCRADFTVDTIVWKDPLAVFAAEAAVTRHGIPVLATVRPPVAVAASFKRMAWLPPVADIEARLASVGRGDAEAIDRYRDRIGEVPVAAAILWRLVYGSLLALAQRQPSVLLVNVKDLVEAPVERYHDLYRRLDLAWSPRVAARIARRHRSAAGESPAPGGSQRAHIAKRDLQSINEYGRKLLTPEETAAIEAITVDLWPAVRAACLAWPAADAASVAARASLA
jgi:hypothetical protein